MITFEQLDDASIVVPYNRRGIPLYVNSEWLSSFPDLQTLAHWHPDIEVVRICQGSMYYHVNEREILLNENDCLVVNSRRMHNSVSFELADCRFDYVIFHPDLISSNQTAKAHFVDPLLEMDSFECFYLASGSKSASKAAGIIDQLVALEREKPPAYSLAQFGLLHFLWQAVFESFNETGVHMAGNAEEIAAMKAMISFVHARYPEKVALDDIAESGRVCRSKCCSLFKKFLGKSPVDFLNAYRMEVSRNLLRQSDLNISQIAAACGFSQQSYYTRMFSKAYGCTPKQFRDRFPN